MYEFNARKRIYSKAILVKILKAPRGKQIHKAYGDIELYLVIFIFLNMNIFLFLKDQMIKSHLIFFMFIYSFLIQFYLHLYSIQYIPSYL